MICLCVSCVVSARLPTVCTDPMEKGPRVTRMRTDTSASGTDIPDTNNAGTTERLYCHECFFPVVHCIDDSDDTFVNNSAADCRVVRVCDVSYNCVCSLQYRVLLSVRGV